MIKSFTSTLLVALLATQLPAASAPLTRLVPADAVLVLSVEDVPRLRREAAEGAIARAWADEDIQAWLAPLREHINWDEFNEKARTETGHTPQEMIDWIQGDVVVMLRNLKGVGEPGAESLPGFVALADFGDNAAKVESFMRRSGERRVAQGTVREEVEKHAGVTVHVLVPQETEEAAEEEYTDDQEEDYSDGDSGEEENSEESSGAHDAPMAWAVNQGVLIVSPQKAQVLATIDAQIAGGVRQPLETSPRFRQLRGTSDRPFDLLFLLRISPLVELLQSTLDRAVEGNDNPMIPKPNAVIQGLGLDAWEDIVATVQSTDEEVVARYRLNYSAPRGLLGLLHTSNPSLPRPAWIPGHWRNVSVYRFDVGQFVPRLKEMLGAISPTLVGMAEGMQGKLAETKGVDLERDLFSNLGDELVVAQQFSPGESKAVTETTSFEEVPQLFAVSVRDAAAVERSIAAVMPQAEDGAPSLLRTRDYLKFQITTLTPPIPAEADGATGPAPAATEVHYAVGGGYLFFATGAVRALEEALQSVASNGDSFWDRRDIQAALSRVPNEATSFQFQDTASLLAVLVNTIEKAAARSAEADEDEGSDDEYPEEEYGEDEAAQDDYAESEDGEEEDEEPVQWTNPEARPGRDVFARYFGDTISYTVQDDGGIEAVSRMATPKP